MVNILMHGCNGAMGQVISKIVKEKDNAVITAGVDMKDDGHNDYPVFSSLKECTEKIDVIIDFSAASAVDILLDFVEEKKIPLVLCTTGLSEDQLSRAKAISEKSPVLRSANMSLGMNILFRLVTEAAAVLAEEGFDIDIVEKHHRLKKDAPSGTAIALADAANEALDPKYQLIFDRSQRREKRPKEEIGLSAVRGGTIVGEHEVIYAGQDEVIELKHTAYSKAIFAKGAVAGAVYLAGKPAGMYDMSDVIQK